MNWQKSGKKNNLIKKETEIVNNTSSHQKCNITLFSEEYVKRESHTPGVISYIREYIGTNPLFQMLVVH